MSLTFKVNGMSCEKLMLSVAQSDCISECVRSLHIGYFRRHHARVMLLCPISFRRHNKRIIFALSKFFSALCLAEDEKTEEKTEAETPKVDDDVGKSRDGSKTDDEAVEREEEAIKLDGLNVAQMKELREKAEKFTFQAEVSRMMKLIINSLYRNKEVRLVSCFKT